MNTQKNLESRIRGWFPQEPLNPNKQTQLKPETNSQNSETENKLMSKGEIRAATAFGIANIIMGGICFYLVLSFVISPNSLSYELTAILWIIFMVSWLSVNSLLVRNYKKQSHG